MKIMGEGLDRENQNFTSFQGDVPRVSLEMLPHTQHVGCIHRDTSLDITGIYTFLLIF